MLRSKLYTHLNRHDILKDLFTRKCFVVPAMQGHLVHHRSNSALQCLCSGRTVASATLNENQPLRTQRLLHQLVSTSRVDVKEQTGHVREIYTNSIKCASSETKPGFTQRQEQLLSEMNMRMINENSFLSWSRNGYLCTIAGVAMVGGNFTELAQAAGACVFVVGGMNLVWGTGCHWSNLIRLRDMLGMSRLTLLLNLLGSLLHCILWLFILICYIGFLDENNSNLKGNDKQQKDIENGPEV